MFMTKHFAIALAASLLAGQAQAYEPRAPEVWERGAAWRASLSQDTEAQRAELRQLLRSGDSEASLALLQALDRDPELPAPVRERLLLDYVNDLRQEPPRAVSDTVMQFLASYPSTVLVAHEDHPRVLVPMFNISTATAGVDNTWTRQESALRGARLLAADAAGLVEAFAASSRLPEQRGLLDALAGAEPDQRRAVAAMAMQQLELRPELAELAGEAALLNGDSDLVGRLLAAAPGETLNRLLSRSADTFDSVRNARLLNTALDSGSPEIAALAIAQLAPVLIGHAPSVDRLFDLLGHPHTGSAAALALAGSPDPDILTRLEAIARAQAGSLAAARALLALELMEAKLLRDVQ